MKNKSTIDGPVLVLGEIGLVQNLGKAGIPVYVGSEIKDNPALYSRYTKRSIFFSDYKTSRFIDELDEFGRTLDQKAVLVSDDDHAILNIAKNQSRLSRWFLFNFPPPEIVEKLLDKQLFCELIEKHDLPSPKSVTLSGVEELNKISALNFPCIIKPSFKQTWWDHNFEKKVGVYQKAITCETEVLLKEKYREIAKIDPHVVVQEFIPGKESEVYSVNLFADNKSEVRGHFIARKLRTYPLSAGEGSYIVTIKDDEMLKMVKSIVEKMQLKGLLNIQFKRDSRTRKPVLLEIHTRNSVWSYLGTASGVNLAEIYYQNLIGNNQVVIKESTPGIVFIFLEKDIKSFIQNIKSRQVSIRRWIKSYFRKFVPGGYLISDPLPSIMKIWFVTRRRLTKVKTN